MPASAAAAGALGAEGVLRRARGCHVGRAIAGESGGREGEFGEREAKPALVDLAGLVRRSSEGRGHREVRRSRA